MALSVAFSFFMFSLRSLMLFSSFSPLYEICFPSSLWNTFIPIAMKLYDGLPWHRATFFVILWLDVWVSPLVWKSISSHPGTFYGVIFLIPPFSLWRPSSPFFCSVLCSHLSVAYPCQRTLWCRAPPWTVLFPLLSERGQGLWLCRVGVLLRGWQLLQWTPQEPWRSTSALPSLCTRGSLLGVLLSVKILLLCFLHLLTFSSAFWSE